MARIIGENSSTTWVLNKFFWGVVLCVLCKCVRMCMHVYTGYQKDSDENLNIFLGEKKKKQICGVNAFIFNSLFLLTMLSPLGTVLILFELT